VPVTRLLVALAIAATAAGAEARHYDLTYRAQFLPGAGVAATAIEVAQQQPGLTLLDLNAPAARYSAFEGDGPIRRDGDRLIWEVPPQGGVRPQLLLVDECQEYLCEEDIRFAATARSAGVCTVMATQSIASVRRALGADGAENLLGVLQTKITHACDGETAQWMSDLIGHDRTYRATVGADGSMSFAETVEPLVPPIAFSRLARGGKRFGFESGAYVFKPGAKWGPDGRNYLKVRLAQRRRG